MKLWQLILVVVLFGGGAVIVYGEMTYRDDLEAAEVLADSLRREVEVFRSGALEAEALRAFLAEEREEYDRTVNEVLDRAEAAEEDALEAEEEAERLEERLASMLDPEENVVADSVNAAHEAQLEFQRAMTNAAREEVKLERGLRVAVDSVLFATEARLKDCECALETAVRTVDTFEEVTDGRGWASRAWDSVTSPRGLVTIGVVGLAAYGAWQLLEDDEPAGWDSYRGYEPSLFVDLAIPIG